MPRQQPEFGELRCYQLTPPQNEEKNMDEEVICKVCDVMVLRKDLKEHRESFDHIEAQKRKHGEMECDKCKEKFPKGCWKQHKKSKGHILKVEQLKETKKVIKGHKPISMEKEIYNVRPASEENQQYINTLTTFLAVRHTLNGGKDFKISINNKSWKDFGDIVVEISDSDKTEIEAIRCKKVEAKNTYNLVALSAEKGKLSLKEQCEILEKLRLEKLKLRSIFSEKLKSAASEAEKVKLEKMLKNENYEKASFKLHTISVLTEDLNPRILYCRDVINEWKKSQDKESWKDREIEITQPRSCKRKDLFNTTNDTDDVCIFKVLKGGNSVLENNLNKFRMYINQKNRLELKLSIKTMIENKFCDASDISDELIHFVRTHFKTDKIVKKNENNFKMTKEDVLLKIAELILVPFLVLPKGAIKEEDLDLWRKTIGKFDVIIMKPDDDIIEKIYKVVNYVIREETHFVLDIFNYVKFDLNDVKKESVKSKLFNHDGTLHFLYVALWKAGLVPLVLKAENEKDFNLILNVVDFLKTESFQLNVIITTNLTPSHVCFPENLKVFLNMQNLKFLNGEILDEILNQKIKMLDFEIPLKALDCCNMCFLKRLTPDVLLNVLLQDYSFKDISVPITKECTDCTVVLEDQYITKMRNYFRKKETAPEARFSYLVTINGQPTKIQVPPQL